MRFCLRTGVQSCHQHQQTGGTDVVANYLNVATYKLGGEGRGAEVTSSPELVVSAQLAVGSE